jgi:hypothetical protein
MDINDPALINRFVLFFDFLGTSEAAKSWPRERVHVFVDLLISIAEVQSVESITGYSQEDGSYRLNVTPEVTTFSDHVVVSYSNLTEVEPPITAPKKGIEVLASYWAKIVCEDAIRILSGVAEMGLQIGLLIRGGFSFGQLYHQRGVVFGEAMIDAYTLECEVAKYPRVVVSDRIIRKITHCQPKDLGIFLQDTDGKWHLNYFAAMVRQATPPPPNTIDQSVFWKRSHLARIHVNIDQLRAAGKQSPAAKWEWFRDQFEAAVSAIPD